MPRNPASRPIRTCRARARRRLVSPAPGHARSTTSSTARRSIPSNWVPQLTSNSGYVNGETACYVDNPDTISVSGGSLNLSVRQVAPFTCSYPGGSFTTSYEAGMVSTYGLFDQTYGAFEVSAKLPAATISGLQETMWLYPQNLTYGAWPDSGEIDFAEFYSQYPGLDVPYVHYAGSASDPDVTAYDCTHEPGHVQHLRGRLGTGDDHGALQRPRPVWSTIRRRAVSPSTSPSSSPSRRRSAWVPTPSRPLRRPSRPRPRSTGSGPGPLRRRGSPPGPPPPPRGRAGSSRHTVMPRQG